MIASNKENQTLILESKKIFKNTSFLIASQIFTFLTSLISLNLLGRYLGVKDFGKLSYAIAIAAILGTFIDWGIRNLIIREIARDKAKTVTYLANSLVLKLFASIMYISVVLAIVSFFNYSVDTKFAIILISLSSVMGALANSFATVLRAYEQFQFESLNKIINSVLVVSLYAVLLFKGYGIFGAATAIFAASIVHFFLMIFFAGKVTGVVILRLYRGVSRIFIIDLLKRALPFALWTIMTAIYFRVDTIMLESMKGLVEVGTYNAAYKLIEMLMFIPLSFCGAIFPNLSRNYSSSKEQFRGAYNKGLKILFLTGLAATVGLMILAPKIIPLIWTEKFTHSVPSLQILSWALFFSFIFTINGACLTAMNRQRFIAFNAFVAVLTNIGLNLILIPKYGAIGASLATVATEAGLFLWSFLIIRREFSVSLQGPVMVKAITCVIFMGVVIHYLKWINVLGVVTIGAAVYLVSIILIGVFSEKEKKIVIGIFDRRRG